jgi:hypothetical protein
MAAATEVIRRSMSTLAGLFTKKLPAGIWQFTFDEVGKGMKYVVNGRRYEFMAINGVMGITIDATNEKHLWYVISDDCTVQIEEVGQSANPFSSIPYYSGVWSPTLAASTPGDLAITYTTQQGYYRVIGDIVHISIRLEINTISHTTASGNWRISMPFAPMTPLEPLFNVLIFGVAYPAALDIVGYMYSSSVLSFYSNKNNGSADSWGISDTTIAAGDRFIISGSYRKA